MTLGISGSNYSFGSGYAGYNGYAGSGRITTPQSNLYRNPYEAYNKKKNEKVGFWEGTKAFFKGIINPIKNMIKHPIKTALFVGASMTLIACTGGAALPLLIGAGFAVGGYQVAKGAYNAITADTREGTLAGLEGMGEGTFTIGASVAGAKSYAAANGGSATAAAAQETTFGAKAVAYAKGLATDSATVLKAVPESAKLTFASLKSGQLTGNVYSEVASTKLAKQKADLVKALREKSPEVESLKAAYRKSLAEYNAVKTANRNALLDKCDVYAEKYDMPQFRQISQDVLNNGYRNNTTLTQAYSKVNPLKNLPEENLGIGIASPVCNNTREEEELLQALQLYGPAFGLSS